MRIEPVASLADPRVAEYRDLRGAGPGEPDGRFVVEGRFGVRRLLSRSRFRPRSVFATPTAVASLRDVLEPLGDATPVFVAELRLLCEVVGYPMHRGCVALADRGPGLPPESLLAAVRRSGAPALVLEDVTNPENVGAIFRNAWAFGVEAVWLTRRCADPLARKSVRVSMGGALFVPWAWIDGAARLALELRECGVRVLALTPDSSAPPLPALPVPRGPGPGSALLLGGEDRGLSPGALASADARVRIALAPGVDSLNVATASAIALHHLAQVREGAGAAAR